LLDVKNTKAFLFLLRQKERVKKTVTERSLSLSIRCLNTKSYRFFAATSKAQASKVEVSIRKIFRGVKFFVGLLGLRASSGSIIALYGGINPNGAPLGLVSQ